MQTTVETVCIVKRTLSHVSVSTVLVIWDHLLLFWCHGQLTLSRAVVKGVIEKKYCS